MTSPQNVKKAAEPADIKNELEWIRFREDILGPAAYGESSSSKFYRKMTENPFVPVGMFATLGALTYGLWCFRQGRGQHSQMMMRTRIGAQAFTIVAVLIGVMYGTTPHREVPDTTVYVEASPSSPPNPSKS